MADTIRDEAALQALFADNTTRSISPQKIRDFLVSVPSLASTANLALVGGTMTGDLLFSTDNTRDIGASGATRPRTGYFGTSLIAGSGTSTGKALQAIGGIGTGLSFTHTGSGNSGQRAKFFLTAGISGYINDGMGLYENYDGADVYHIATANKSLFLGGRYNTTNTASVTILNDQAKARALDVLGSIALISAVGTIDTALARNAAGVVEVTNGTAGTYRDLKLRQTTHAYLSPGTQTAQIYFEPSTGNGLGLNAASNGSAIIVTSNTGGTDMAIRTSGIDVSSQGAFNWTNTTSNPLTTIDLRLSRRASLVLGIHGNYNSTAGAALEFMEMTAPAAPATNSVRIFAEDNGSGKTRLMAQFATGAVQQLAIEP